ncbi:MAG: hypothetical protein JWN86_4261 [Planctomycetota bacterium]|nr:hypothetical protein [Planctomycetota bacterium]
MRRETKKASWRTVLGAGAALGLLGLAGCSKAGSGSIGTTYEVKGQVLLADGSPLKQGRVAFVPTDPATVPASGEIGPDGQFSLTTKTPDDGALPGEYKVRIEPAALGVDPKKAKKPPYPIKYIDEDSSTLVITVRAEPNRLEPIRLK